MANNENQYAHITYRLMEQLLEVDNLEEALSGSLEIIVKELNCEVGAIWMLDEKTDRLHPVFNTGPVDISNISVENGIGIAGLVTKTEKSMIIEDASDDPRYEGMVFEDQGLSVKSLICVPLKDHEKIIGCMQLVNKTDGNSYTAEELQVAERMASLAAITIEEKGLLVNETEEKEVLITLDNVIKDYYNPGRTSRVLKGINLNIYKGELLVVLGESGCGKSTMMNIIGGMDSLTEGKLIVEGKDYSHPSDSELTAYRRNYIGFIFQSYNLMPNLSAIENVRFIAELCEDPMAPQEALERVGLGEKGNNFPAQMSGGQQQRVAIARALVKKPKLILADEPTAALDHETSIEVLKTIETLVKQNDTTVIMITHNPEIGKMADRVVKLRGGRVFSIKRNIKPLPAAELEW